MDAVRQLAEIWRLWIVEDAAHAFPAARRSRPQDPWRRCGEATADVTCFSFYANKTITTGEGGMAVTPRAELAERMRLMSLHGLSHDAWSRYAANGTWDYQIIAPGYKYNLTDVASAIGIHQIARAEEMRQQRERIALEYRHAFGRLDEVKLPDVPVECVHAWHLFPLTLRLEQLSIDRNGFVEELKRLGVATSVHWRPLHMHPYYRRVFGYKPEDCPNAAARFERVVSLPIFSAMTPAEISSVISTVFDTITRYRVRAPRAAQAARAAG
jgi:dTDP-4-amino-4,6-dideoxygalactose transaminase